MQLSAAIVHYFLANVDPNSNWDHPAPRIGPPDIIPNRIAKAEGNE
jgi:hypothetical protein